MKQTELNVESIVESAWNPNQMDFETKNRLRASIRKYGLVAPLVVRKINPYEYETIGGAHRLGVIKELGLKTVECVVVASSDANARLLAQALNGIAGTDDPKKLQASLDVIFESIPVREVLQLLPEAEHSISNAVSFSLPSLLDHLKKFEKSRTARLNHFSGQLTDGQLETVLRAVAHAKEHGPLDVRNPNKRGNALFFICQTYLETAGNL